MSNDQPTFERSRGVSLCLCVLQDAIGGLKDIYIHDIIHVTEPKDASGKPFFLFFRCPVCNRFRGLLSYHISLSRPLRFGVPLYGSRMLRPGCFAASSVTASGV